jgi:hypothetical protein
LFQSITAIAISDGCRIYVGKIMQAAICVNLEGLDPMMMKRHLAGGIKLSQQGDWKFGVLHD